MERKKGKTEKGKGKERKEIIERQKGKKQRFFDEKKIDRYKRKK